MDISPEKQNLDRVFSNTTYYIDFYQRDYKWSVEPVTRLLDDIFYGFDETYEKKQDLDPNLENIVAYYPWYYLNTYVTNTIEGHVYIVDGQQRLTTITLILIKLLHLAKSAESKLARWIEGKISGQSGFEQQFWLNHERHVLVLEFLMSNDSDLDRIDTTTGITAKNMVGNYKAISARLSRELGNKKRFETFVFYCLHRIVMVNLAVEQTDVPMVFEVINDRGVRLRPYEILKGKLLGQIDKRELTADNYNGFWETQITKVNDDEIDTCLRYYLKAKFADSRNIGERFDGDYHREIFKDDLDQKLHLEHNPVGVKDFINGAFRYFTNLYADVRDSILTQNETQPWLYFNSLNEMDTQYLLVLSACRIDDPEKDEKITLISKHLDRLFTFLRLQRAYDSNDFNDAIYAISKAIREQPSSQIDTVFNGKLLGMLSENRNATVTDPFQYAFFKNTSVADVPARFTRYFFARIDAFFAKEMGIGVRHNIGDIVTKTGPKTGFHIEHILAHNDENLASYGGDVNDFEEDRNRLGAILLLKGRDNQSSNKEQYSEKLKTYANTLYWNETLRKDTYKSKLDLGDMIKRHKLSLQPYDKFGPEEVEARQKVLFELASIIWK
jgi:uncharacterized protein with ParB-like and HNH nuclease domain